MACKHSLIKITSNTIDNFANIEEVVMWCEKCGAIVVDMVMDGIVHPGGYIKMKVPQSYHLIKE